MVNEELREGFTVLRRLVETAPESIEDIGRDVESVIRGIMETPPGKDAFVGAVAGLLSGRMRRSHQKGKQLH